MGHVTAKGFLRMRNFPKNVFLDTIIYYSLPLEASVQTILLGESRRCPVLTHTTLPATASTTRTPSWVQPPFKNLLPWPGGSVGWGIVLYTRRQWFPFPGRAHNLGCRFNLRSGHVWEANDYVSLSRWCFSLSLSLFKIKTYFLNYFKKKNLFPSLLIPVNTDWDPITSF